jgi:photosystem II stability/assembly factor-like uncharacterized protein
MEGEMTEVMLLIGTRKGAFLAFSDPERREWRLEGPVFKGVQVHDVAHLQSPQPGIVVAGKSSWWGPAFQVSHDYGRTWSELPGTPAYAPDRGRSVERIWVLEEDRREGRMRWYAGVDPGGLFLSEDGGGTWSELTSLSDHPTRERWFPGAGGLMVHCVCFDSAVPHRLFVGISAAGTFRSDDGGLTWNPKNKGVRTDFLPEKLADVGQCVHHLVMHPSKPEVLYQQNHCGVYRTENSGEDWVDISEGLPSRFGFPIAVHPHDGDTVYVVPEESDEFRTTPGGAFRVYRSRNRGDTWEALTQGLPQVNAHMNIMRAALATDTLDRPGVYVGTQGGQLVASRDEGDHWELLFNWLPPVYSVRAAVIER